MLPLISIVIPVYNTERYLRRCMESVVHQTYRNLEIICVDDGSTDGSGAVLDAYAARDRRVRVVHQENGGLVAARKAGIALAAGEYVSYVDSDDEISLTRYEELLHKGIEQKADMIFTDVTQVYGDGSRMKMKNHFAEGFYDRGRIDNEIMTHLCDEAHFLTYRLRTYSCGVVFSRDLLVRCQNMVDDAIKYGEDTSCVLQCLADAKSVYMAHGGRYDYYKNLGSMSHVKRDSEEIRAKAYRSNRAHYAHLKKLLPQFPVRLQPVIEKEFAQMMFFEALLYEYERVLDCVASREKIFPFDVPYHHRVVVYGAGAFGIALYRYLSSHGGNPVLWCDRAWERCRAEGLDVHAPEEIKTAAYDTVLMAIGQYEVAETAAEALSRMGVPRNKLMFMDSRELTQERLDKIYGI